MSKFPQLGVTDTNVVNLINARSKSNYETSKMMAWMRIASALNIEDVDGNGMILESTPPDATFSTTYGDTTKSGRVGVDFNGKSIYAESDRSFRPSPTIESLSLTNNARGLSRKASFSITCYTLAQAEKLSPYFMEPGYTVLIEYGWNSSGTHKTSETAAETSYNSHEQKSDLKTPCDIAKYNNWSYILNKRINSAGTYDGFMGFITGGGMKSGDNETWILDVEVTTLGEIPAYLQQNRSGGELKGDIEVTGKTFDVGLIESAEDADKIGEKYFMMMYNRLPAGKRTENLKSLMGQSDFNEIKFSNKGNFINMEPELAEVLSDKFSGEDVDGGGELKVKVPSGVSIFTDQSYIRLELAFAIIDNYVMELAPTKVVGCSVDTFSYKIETDQTIIRAHKYMFSTDPSVLFIPNTNLPDFGLKYALAASTEEDTEFVKLNDDGTPTKTINACPYKHQSDELVSKYAFPSTIEYGGKNTNPKVDDATVEKTIGDAHKWGYLRNLYINLDFFIGILEKTNYVAKDCYYDILNGMSTAVNAHWNFQISESTKPGTDGKLYGALTVNDLSFIGKVKKEFIKSVPTFAMAGVESPFITANLTVDIPAAMQNSILGKRNKLKVEPQVDGHKIELDEDDKTGLFTSTPDPVMAILDSFREKVPQPPAKPPPDPPKPPPESEVRKANFDLFMGNATVIPFTADDASMLYKSTGISGWFRRLGDENLSTLQSVMLVATWGDVTLLNKLEHAPYDAEPDTTDTTDPMLLPISFEFEIHGTSGLQLGDVIKISDLPKKYEKTILQIVEINHQLSGMLWVTSVKSQFRRVG
jgi:hypothetical protein